MKISRIPALCLALTVAATPSHGFEIFGFKFFEKEAEQAIELIDPQPYRVTFSMPRADEELSSFVEATSSLVSNSGQPASGRAGLLSMANGDYSRLLDTLYSRGYYGGRISITIDGREASDVPLDVTLKRVPKIAITVNAGKQYQFGQAEVVNVAPGTNLPEDFAVGKPAYSVAVRDAGQTAIQTWQEAGFAKADIPQTSIIADHSTQRLDAELVVTPGPKVVYGPTTVTGTDRVDHTFLAFMAGLDAGKTYSPKDIETARKRIRKLDTFSVVTIDETAELEAGNAMPIDIAVKDRRPRRLGFGATVSTLDGAGVEAFWLHRNIFGRAERLRFEGSVKGIGRTADPKDYDYALGTTFVRPGTFTPDTDFSLGIKFNQESLDNYDLLASTLTAGLSTTFTERLTGNVDFIIERSRIDDDLGRRRFTLTGLDGGLTYERRDDPLDATSGYFIEATAFPFYENSSSQFGLQSTVEARAYTSFSEDKRFVLAGRAKIGSVTGIGLTEAPPQVLFFSGGGGSVRGFSYQSNGVVLSNGRELGGRSLVEGSLELRARVSESFGVVGFIDGGLVGPDSTPDFSEPIKVGVGGGLRWKTGLGPLRIDIARAVNRQSSDPQVGVYLGLGQAF